MLGIESFQFFLYVSPNAIGPPANKGMSCEDNLVLSPVAVQNL